MNSLVVTSETRSAGLLEATWDFTRSTGLNTSFNDMMMMMMMMLVFLTVVLETR